MTAFARKTLEQSIKFWQGRRRYWAGLLERAEDGGRLAAIFRQKVADADAEIRRARQELEGME